MRFRFIEDHRADYPVRVMCGVLDVSPAGYYAWRSRPDSRRYAANRDLLGHIAADLIEVELRFRHSAALRRGKPQSGSKLSSNRLCLCL
jgi:hypothetical protein